MHQCGVLGVRVGEASHLGPRVREKHRRRLASSSDDEFLSRPNEGRDVITRTDNVSGFNRFAILADVETVPDGTPESEEAGVGRRTSFDRDQVRVSSTLSKWICSDLVLPWRIRSFEVSITVQEPWPLNWRPHRCRPRCQPAQSRHQQFPHHRELCARRSQADGCQLKFPPSSPYLALTQRDGPGKGSRRPPSGTAEPKSR